MRFHFSYNFRVLAPNWQNIYGTLGPSPNAYQLSNIGTMTHLFSKKFHQKFCRKKRNKKFAGDQEIEAGLFN